MTGNEFADSFEMWVYLIVALLIFALICLGFCLFFKAMHWAGKQSKIDQHKAKARTSVTGSPLRPM